MGAGSQTRFAVSLTYQFEPHFYSTETVTLTNHVHREGRRNRTHTRRRRRPWTTRLTRSRRRRPPRHRPHEASAAGAPARHRTARRNGTRESLVPDPDAPVVTLPSEGELASADVSLSFLLGLL